MKRLADSCFGLGVAVLLAAAPVSANLASAAAPAAPPVTISVAQKPAKAGAKPAAKPAPVEPQPDPALLIAQSRDAQNRGDFEMALRLAQSAIVADPARPAGYDALAEVYAANNQPEAARSYYSEALSVDPGDAAAEKALSALDHGGPVQQDAKAGNEGSKTATP